MRRMVDFYHFCIHAEPPAGDRMKRIFCAGFGWLLSVLAPGASASDVYAFGVLNHRSVHATAVYWNPILDYVSARSGVPLELHIGRTANETTDRVVAGKLDFAFTNHLFTPRRDRLRWRVLARQDTPGIRGQIVVPAESPVRRLQDLAGKPVAFANPYAFVGYYVPMDILLHAGVEVSPQFAGNQEAAMGQLLSGAVAAAGVNDQVMAGFARVRGFDYRVLAQSDSYFDLAVMASPRVSAADGEKVRRAFVGMLRDPVGRRVLENSAATLKLPAALGFVFADDDDYANYRDFFRRSRVALNE